jgi:hypothetical protein
VTKPEAVPAGGTLPGVSPSAAGTRTALVAWGVGVGIAVAAFLVYWLTNRSFEAGRGDFFYLAEAFLHGRSWIDRALGAYDVIYGPDGRVFVPFAPFPAIALMPLVAVVGAEGADRWESGINAGLAAFGLLLAWWVTGRIGVRRVRDRLGLVLLLGFGTQMWWVTTRGGVWHTGHLIAIILAMLMLAELFGKQRALLLGLLVGASFLTRAPVAFAGPAIALWYWLLTPDHDGRLGWIARIPWRQWLLLILGFLPALAVFFVYNAARFGTPLESGYALATLPDWLEALRRQGLFSPAHIPMNLNYLLLHLPIPASSFPYLRPDGLGMSVFLTSPGLLLFLVAPWRDRRTWALAAAALFVLVPTLLYYGGGWFQFGFRYFLDSVPFVWALAVMGIARRDGIPWWGWALILWGVLMGAYGTWWTYHL